MTSFFSSLRTLSTNNGPPPPPPAAPPHFFAQPNRETRFFAATPSHRMTTTVTRGSMKIVVAFTPEFLARRCVSLRYSGLQRRQHICNDAGPQVMALPCSQPRQRFACLLASPHDEGVFALRMASVCVFIYMAFVRRRISR